MAVCALAYSQKASATLPVAWDFYAIGGVSTIHNRSFSKFAESFGQYYANYLKKPLPAFGSGYCRELGTEVRVSTSEHMQLEFGVFGINTFGKATALYNSGSKEVFAYKRHQWGVAFGGGPTMGRSSLSFTLGFSGGSSTIDVYHVYLDGVESHGGEITWNGVYNAWSMASSFNIKYYFRFTKHLNLLAQCSYAGTILGGESYDDDNYPRWANPYILRPISLPTNLGAYAADPYHTGDVVNSKSSHWQLQLGLCYQFNLQKAE